MSPNSLRGSRGDSTCRVKTGLGIYQRGIQGRVCHMIPDDFNPEITVSYLPLYSLTTLDQIIGNMSLVPKS